MKIHIIGGAGSGKTYAAKHLGEMVKTPVYELDHLYWDTRHEKKASDQHRHAQLQGILARDSWIVEGIYYRWVQDSFEQADIIFVINTPVWIRQWRIIHRFIRRKSGKLRDGHIPNFGRFVELLVWNQSFDRHNMPRIIKALRPYRRKVVICGSSAEVIDYVAKLQASQDSSPHRTLTR